jgi:DNA (cytosine-5)-methyltransferase 1
MPDGSIVVPDIRDAERLQGFPADWTLPVIDAGGRKGMRWKLVGNAVSVPLATWVGERLRAEPTAIDDSLFSPLEKESKWPIAAWGGPKAKPHAVSLSMWPVRRSSQPLADFLTFPTTPLSERATAGFYSRLTQSSLRIPPGFLEALRGHLSRITAKSVA